MTTSQLPHERSPRESDSTLDAAERLALDWAAEHSWPRIVVWGDDVRALAAAARTEWPDAQVAMWNDRIGEEVPGVVDVAELPAADLVLLRLPKSLAALTEWVSAVNRQFPSATLVAAGRVKHMTARQNDILKRFYDTFDVTLARQKSRLLIANDAFEPEAVEPVRVMELDDRAGTATGLRLAEVPGVFAAASLDIGARALLEALDATLPESGADELAIDLGCGSGIVAAWLARRGYRVRASDISRAAVQATTATAIENGLDSRIHVHWEDALADVPSASASLIVLNPPFHEGTTVTTDPAHRLFEAAARVLAPGGVLITVWNSHLGYRAALEQDVGATEQLSRTAKFTVARSVRA